MHPMVITALAAEVKRDHAHQREQLQLRSLAGENRPGIRKSRTARDFARQLISGIGRRPRLS